MGRLGGDRQEEALSRGWAACYLGLCRRSEESVFVPELKQREGSWPTDTRGAEDGMGPAGVWKHFPVW